MLYATGGVAFAGIDNSITDISGFFVPAGTSASFSNTRVGWTAGGGIEYAVTNNWSVQAEYRYSNFGNITNSPFIGITLAPGGVVHTRRQLNENQVQVGFSYKFDTWAPYPVVAKY